MKALTRKDDRGRVWVYCDCEGTWSHADHLIGCAAKNGRRFMFWSSDDKYPEEFKTLREAMISV